MKSGQQQLFQRINERYDRRMYDDSIDEYYSYSGFHNFGYWTPDTQNQCEASENLVDRLIAMLPHRNGKILDVACGMGASAKRLLREYQPPDVTGINISDTQLASCRERAPGCQFLNMDATRLRFPDHSFDNILCVEAVFHFDTREKFLREAYRVLKPGGSLALSDILLRSKWINDLVERIPLANYVPNLEDYKSLYVRCGFESVRIIEARTPCWEGFKRSRVRFTWGKALAGLTSQFAVRRVKNEMDRWDWAIEHYLLVSARRPRGRA